MKQFTNIAWIPLFITVFILLQELRVPQSSCYALKSLAISISSPKVARTPRICSLLINVQPEFHHQQSTSLANQKNTLSDIRGNTISPNRLCKEEKKTIAIILFSPLFVGKTRIDYSTSVRRIGQYFYLFQYENRVI